ncbi:hypothetical protein HYS31_03105 [Candidatus Woesearchaeota archaeon]|nr:hypothetical protein [Candidatus Woesearchaeota archaeon]
MQLIHNLGILSVKKEEDGNAGFLLTNKKGSYCSFPGTQNSRYNGLFLFDEAAMRMFKFIESIEVIGNETLTAFRNGFYFTERANNKVVESFFMPSGFNSLIYELSKDNEFNVILDCKESYDNRTFGRYYEIFEEDGCIIIKFTKKTDKREDKAEGQGEFSLHLAIKSDKMIYKKNDAWIERSYPLDAQRNSPPNLRYAYNALRMKGSKFVFSMARKKGDAVKECCYVFANLENIKAKEKENFFGLLMKNSIRNVVSGSKPSNDVKIAYVCCANALNSLVVNSKKSCGVLAGLPWFFQFWARDSLVSLKACSNIDREFSEKLLFRFLQAVESDGRLQNFQASPKESRLGSADAAGWLFLRCNDAVERINRNKSIINSVKKSISSIKENGNASPRICEYIKKCNAAVAKREDGYHRVIYEIESSLERCLHGLLKYHAKDGFEVNTSNETWMDAGFGTDTRSGARIEIQAFRLNMYRLMFELTQNHKYKALENVLKNKVRKEFWNGKMLADGLDDFTIRPNIFIAYYAYPELLSREEWEVCFENALKALWLDWGGLSTIDKSSPLYVELSTGEDKRSYHRGDSWFWLNNLAAICMHRLNKAKFQKYIRKIIEASTEEILWKGCIGCHAELSDAKELSSKGCWSQAWSNAMFMEMVEEFNS